MNNFKVTTFYVINIIFNYDDSLTCVFEYVKFNFDKASNFCDIVAKSISHLTSLSFSILAKSQPIT